MSYLGEPGSSVVIIAGSHAGEITRLIDIAGALHYIVACSDGQARTVSADDLRGAPLEPGQRHPDIIEEE